MAKKPEPKPNKLLSYAGIGARSTPKEFLKPMEEVAAYLANEGWNLRSGGAHGADSAFERGCDSVEGHKEIFLPWKGHNDSDSKLYGVGTEALKEAAKHHPNWKRLKDGAKIMMGRNVYQVMGPEHNDLSKLIICWTPKGEVVGGTGQALRMANHYKIPVINFGNLSFEEIEKQLLELTNVK